VQIYLYAAETGCQPTQALGDIIVLWAAGVLNTDATVWCNASAPEPVLWALTDHSHLIYVHRPAEPGYVRLTAGRARWARTHNDTAARAQLDLDLAALPGDHDRQTTIVVAHRMPPAVAQVGVIAGTSRGSLRCDMSDGHYSHAATRTAVIDLPLYRSKHGIDLIQAATGVETGPAPAVSEYERSNASVNGMKLLTLGLPEAERDRVRRHLDTTCLRLPIDYLAELHGRLTSFDQWACQILPTMSALLANS
jgi:hypothetical protein